MKGPGLTATFRIQLIAMIAVFSQSCGMIHTASPSRSCSANQTIVNIYSGSITSVCGCQEGSNRTFSFGQPFTCTVSVGTSVFFYYPGINMQHMISITGGPNQGSLNPHDPSQTNPADVFPLNSSGTVSFFDYFQPQSVFGTFTVQ